MNTRHGAAADRQDTPSWRSPAQLHSVLRLRPGERWFPDGIVEIDAKVSDAPLAARVLSVEVTRRRAGKGSVVSHSFACMPAHACYRDLCWWLRTLPSCDTEIEDRVVEWSSSIAESVVEAAHARYGD